MVLPAPTKPKRPGPDPAFSPNPQSELSDLDKLRLANWFRYDERLVDIAEECKTNVVDLGLWAAQPHIRAILDIIQDVARQRTATLYAEAQHAAISRLHIIVRTETNNEVARRAADRLLRPSTNPKIQDLPPPPAPKGRGTSARSNPDAPSAPEPAATEPANAPTPSPSAPTQSVPSVSDDSEDPADPDDPQDPPTARQLIDDLDLDLDLDDTPAKQLAASSPTFRAPPPHITPHPVPP